MIQHIVLHCGSHRYISEVQHLVLNNLALFEQQGVFYPLLPFPGKGEPYRHEALLRMPEASLGEQLLSFSRNMETLHQPTHTLLLSLDHALYCPEQFFCLLETLKKNFPGTTVRCAADFTPQHSELYSIFCMANFVRLENIRSGQELLARYRDALLYDQTITSLQHAFGPDNLYLAHPSSSEEQGLQHARQSLLRALWLADKPNFVNSLNQDRCYLNFMAPLPLVHMHLQAPQLYFCIVWFSKYQELSALAQSRPEFYALFTRQEKQSIAEYYQESNAKTATMFGVARLFPQTDEGPDIPAYSGLNNEQIDLILDCASEPMKGALLFWSNALLLEQPDPAFSSYVQRYCKAHFLPIKPQRQSSAKLAVLTHSYNQSAYIAQAIESVLAQETDFAVEHLISDDGSTDGTQDIIMDYARKYPSIVPLFKSHGGAPNTYNLFKNACTPYVSLCDGDDYFIDPHKLQIQVDFLEVHKDCALCFHPVEVRYENNAAPTRLYPPLDLLPRGVRERYYVSDLIKTNLMQTNSVVYRWRFQEGLPEWFDPTLTMGDWYWHLLHAELGPIGFINRVMGVYRRHDKSLYYTSEVSMREHRLKHGMEELRTYETVNRHFGNKYEKSIFSLANGAFAQYLSYALDTGDNGPLEKAAKMFPHFAAVFKASLKLSKVQR